MPHRFVGHRLATVYAQPFESAIALVLLLSGTAMAIDEKYTPSSIAALEWPWNILFRVLVLLAGTLMLAGLLRGKHRWSFGLEMTGMVCAAIVFFTYAGGLAENITQDGHRAIMGCLTYFIVAIACVIKTRALWIEAHNRLQLIKELPLPDNEEGNDQ